jgi:acyl-CoA thioester hydrolase
MGPRTPAPIVVRVRRRVAFSDADPMAVLWHGRYAVYFEAAYEELGRRCGLGCEDFREARLLAPVVQFHVDYFASPVVSEEVTIVGRLVWNDGARMNTEFEILKADGSLAASGYTVQMFVTPEGEPLLASPPLLDRCRQRWLAGEFATLS